MDTYCEYETVTAQKHGPCFSTNRVVRHRITSKIGMRKLRERRRTKEDKRDPVAFFQVPLPQSVVDQLAAELKIKNNIPISDRDWRALIGDVVASVVKSAVTK
jgi:hypothetical protein